METPFVIQREKLTDIMETWSKMQCFAKIVNRF